MWNEKDVVQTHKNEILKICARFYTELYSYTLQDQHPSLKNTSPDSIRSPTDHAIRSQEKSERNEKQHK